MIRAGVVAVLCLWQQSAASAGDATTKELFELLNNRFEKLASLSYTVSRTTTAGIRSVEEKWDFKLKAPGLIKVECFKPMHRLIMINDEAIWEYIPAAKKAMRTDLAAMPAGKKETAVASLLAHVAVNGLRLGEYAGMLPRVTGLKRGTDNIYTIQGANPKFVVQVDGEKGCLVRSEFYNEKDELMLQTEASGFVKAGSEFWFPGNIKVTCRVKDSMIKSEIVMTNVKVNEELSAKLFHFSPPKGVQVMKN